MREGGRKRRNALMAALDRAGFQTRPGTHAVHRLGYYVKKYGHKPEQFTNACTAEDTTIALPIVPEMITSTQERVVAILKDALRT